MFSLKVGPQFVFLFAGDCTVAFTASSRQPFPICVPCFFFFLPPSLLWQTRRVMLSQLRNLAGYWKRWTQIFLLGEMQMECAFWLSKHGPLHFRTSSQSLNLNVNSFIFPLFFCVDDTLKPHSTGAATVHWLSLALQVTLLANISSVQNCMAVRMSQCSWLKRGS